jgi:hypothetical protein
VVAGVAFSNLISWRLFPRGLAPPPRVPPRG